MPKSLPSGFIRHTLKILSLHLLFLSTEILSGQSTGLPISVSIFNESTAIPFTRFLTFPVHPGLQVGTEFPWSASEHTRLFQTANISYFYHQYLTQGIGLNSELGFEYRTRSGFASEALFGIGYMHTFATATEYTWTQGHYEIRGDKGNARIYPSLTLGIGYYLNPEITTSPEIFFKYQAWIEYPYSPDFIPVMTHINFHVGFKTYLQSKS